MMMNLRPITKSAPVAYCPQCGRKLASLPYMQVATEVVRRKCQQCKSRWQIVVKPVRRGGAIEVTVAEFVAL